MFWENRTAQTTHLRKRLFDGPDNLTISGIARQAVPDWSQNQYDDTTENVYKYGSASGNWKMVHAIAISLAISDSLPSFFAGRLESRF